MTAEKILKDKILNLHTDFSFLNTVFNEKFLTHNIHYLTFMDNDIISHGTSNDCLNIIYSGRVRVIRTYYASNIITSYNLQIGDMFGIENIIDYNGIDYLSTVSSIGETVICYIHKKDLTEHIKDANIMTELFKHYIKTMDSAINP